MRFASCVSKAFRSPTSLSSPALTARRSGNGSSSRDRRYGPRAPRPSKLDPYKPYLDQRLSAGVWNAVVLLRELRGRGYSGGYSILKDYLSIPAQLRAIRKFADENKLTIVQEFTDVESAKEPGRKNFTEMMAKLKQRSDVAGVVTHKLDRLLRNLSDYADVDDLHAYRVNSFSYDRTLR